MTRRARTGVLMALTAALLVLPSGSLAQGGGCAGADLPVVDAASAKTASAALYCLVNEFRAANGRPALKRSTKLEKAARRHAGEMERSNYVSHVNRAGENLDRRLRKARYPRKGRPFRSSETVGWGTGVEGTARGLLRVLERSSEHRNRVLRQGFKDLGAALVAGVPVNSPASGATVALIFGRR